MNRLAFPLVALALLATSSLPRAEDKPLAPLSRAEIDERLFKQLREVINRGATIHNNGDAAGCYRVFQGALMSVSALLDHRPALQAAITKGLRDADQMPDPSDSAFALRQVIDTIRSTLRKDQPLSLPAKAPAKEPAKEPGKDKDK